MMGVKQMAKDMDRVDFSKGDLLLDQGAPQTKAFFIADGTIKRERVVNDQSHQVRACANSVCCPSSICVFTFAWAESGAMLAARVCVVREQVIDVFGNTEPDKFGNRKVSRSLHLPPDSHAHGCTYMRAATQVPHAGRSWGVACVALSS